MFINVHKAKKELERRMRVKLEIMTEQPTNQPTDGLKGKFHSQQWKSEGLDFDTFC